MGYCGAVGNLVGYAPLPGDGAWRNSTKTQQTGHTKGLDQKSKMEEVVPISQKDSELEWTISLVPMCKVRGLTLVVGGRFTVILYRTNK